jgi:hypothetical protein
MFSIERVALAKPGYAAQAKASLALHSYSVLPSRLQKSKKKNFKEVETLESRVRSGHRISVFEFSDTEPVVGSDVVVD